MRIVPNANGEQKPQDFPGAQGKEGENEVRPPERIGWLSNTPEYRKALKEIQSDIAVLLEHLGQSPDARLQASFEDTRVRLPPVTPIVPPCRTYQHFLRRISVINQALEDIDAEEPQRPKGSKKDKPEGDEDLDNVSFMYWCRDFLSGVAAPACVASIQITACYIENRLRWRTLKGEASDGVQEVGDERKIRIRQAADWIARNVKVLEVLGIIFLSVTLLVSMGTLAVIDLQSSGKQVGDTVKTTLDCITHYLLPCLYGYLGAAVATMRYVRRKIDASSLTFTDRARITYNQVLGIIIGGVVGLFAVALDFKGGEHQSLGVSAIAFLAGYNITSWLCFLDTLSLKVFEGSASRRTNWT
jgi:hypothetical protein